MKSIKAKIAALLYRRGWVLTRTDKVWRDIERLGGADEAELIKRVIDEGLTMTSPAKLHQTLAAVT